MSLGTAATVSGLFGTWLGVYLAFRYYRKGSADLRAETLKLRIELFTLRELIRFQLRTLTASGQAQVVQDDDGFAIGYRLKDANGTETVYLPGVFSATANSVIVNRARSGKLDWEDAGLSGTSLDLLIWMSYRNLASPTEDDAAKFVYRGPDEIEVFRTVAHPATKTRHSAKLVDLQELVQEGYLSTKDESDLKAEGVVFLDVEATAKIFPWMRS